MTDHYGINPIDIPFVDTLLHFDTRLFLEPRAILNRRNDPLSMRAYGLLRLFFDEILRCIQSTSPADMRKGERLLQNLHEPNETRLGMSRSRVAGHGLADGMGTLLWDSLRSNLAVQANAVTVLEQLPVIVDGIGPDLISDLTTRIAYDVLVEFTNQMISAYPTLGRNTTERYVDLFDPVALDWVSTKVELPYVAPHQLLLIPKGWVYWRTLFTPTGFYNNFATATVQAERTVVLRSGKLSRPSKEKIKIELPDIRPLNVHQIVKYSERGVALLEEYGNLVDERHHELTDAQLRYRMRG